MTWCRDRECGGKNREEMPKSDCIQWWRKFPWRTHHSSVSAETKMETISLTKIIDMSQLPHLLAEDEHEGVQSLTIPSSCRRW